MRSITISLMVAALAIAVTAPPFASAQDGQKGMGHNMPAFSDFDLDGDGTLSKDEFYKARSERIAKRAQAGGKMKNLDKAPSFESIDGDGDGAVSREEFSAHQDQRKAGRVQR